MGLLAQTACDAGQKLAQMFQLLSASEMPALRPIGLLYNSLRRKKLLTTPALSRQGEAAAQLSGRRAKCSMKPHAKLVIFTFSQ